MANDYKKKANDLAWVLVDKMNDMTKDDYVHLVEGLNASTNKKGLSVVRVPGWTQCINLTGKTWEDVCDSAMAALATCEVISASINETKEG